MSEKNSSNSWLGPVLTLIGVFVTALFGYKALTDPIQIPIKATQTVEARLTAAALPTNGIVTAGAIHAINTLEPAATPASMTPFVGYDFESSIQGWAAAEEKSKKAELHTTTQVVYVGNSALELDTELFGSGSAEYSTRGSKDVYRHTEVAVYMNSNKPAGYDQPGPYDLTGKTLSCFVYVPDGLAVEGPHAYIRLLAKDTAFKNQFSPSVDITMDTVNQWVELSFVAGDGANEDDGFDSKQINGLGVRLDSLDGSTAEYTGPVYIDNCSIK